jgi:predicted phage terminase large subunit-like protein
MQMQSPAEILAGLPSDQRDAELAKLSVEVRAHLRWHWPFWARPNQLEPPGDWRVWAAVAGRGFGKTRLGSEWVRKVMCGTTPMSGGRHHRMAIVAETAADARDVLVEGDSGILAVHPPAFRPHYEPSKRRLTWPNGAMATLFNAVEPDQLRGPQHDAALCDEIAKWRYSRDTWDQLQFGLRLGNHPRVVVTTTPRPIPVLKEIMAAPDTVVTRGSTMDNAANLAPSFMKAIQDRYAGTRLGRQELDAEMLDDVPGALWTRAMIDATRVRHAPALRRVVVSVDPSGTRGDGGGDDIGIVVAGVGTDGRGYVFEDCSCQMSPEGWARVAVNAYERHGADRIIAETNFGGDMVRALLATAAPNVPFKAVTASRGKIARAEPVAALYEQGRVSHVGGLPQLEDQMVAMTPAGYMGEGRSPDRADALVWALTELMVGATYSLDGL